DIGGNAVPRAAEQLVQGQVARFADNVPDGDVDRRDRHRVDTEPQPAGLIGEAGPDLFIGEGIHAYGKVGQVILDQRADGGSADVDAIAESGATDAGIGCYLDDDELQGLNL